MRRARLWGHLPVLTVSILAGIIHAFGWIKSAWRIHSLCGFAKIGKPSALATGQRIFWSFLILMLSSGILAASSGGAAFAQSALPGANLKVCGNSLPFWGAINQTRMSAMKAKLSNTANFGPSGTYSTSTFTFQDIGNPTTASLTANGCNVWISGYDNTAAYTALATFAANGGFVIGGCDNSAFSAVCQGMGYSVTNYSNVGGAYTVVSPINPLTCSNGAPSSSLALTTAGGASSYFTSGVVYARYNDANAFPLVVMNSATAPFMVLTGDIDMFTTNNANLTAGSAIISDQDKFVANVFKLAADRVTGVLSSNGQPSCGNISTKAWITLNKISVGGVGPFTFTGNNGWASQTITTTTAGVGVAGQKQTLNGATATTITEAIPSGWAMSSVTCTGTGGGTQPTVNLSTGVISFTAAQMANGSNIQCTVTNSRSTSITLTKVSNGGTGTFAFTGDNGWNSQTITTTIPGAGVAGTTQTLAAASTVTTLTEAAVPGYRMTGVTCTGTGGGTQPTVNLTAQTIQFSAAQTVSGSTIACTVTNERIPTVKIQKTTLGGFGGPFSFARTNLAAIPNITTTIAGTPAPASPAALNVTTTGAAVTMTETPLAGYTLTSASCTDANSAVTGNAGSIGTLAGNVLTIPALAVKAGAEFTCVFTNTLNNPSLTIIKSYNLTKGPGNTGTSAEAGDTITYSYVVTNNGNQVITNVDVDDSGHTGQGPWVDPAHAGTITTDNGPTGDSPDSNGDPTIWGTLAPLDVITFSSNYVVTQADMDGQM